MMRVRRFLPALAGAIVGCAVSAEAQQLVTDVSREIVELRYDFAGTELLLFGAIKHPPRAGERVDLVATVVGPSARAVVRRKARIAGLWINAEEVLIDGAPGYFAQASTAPLAAIADAATLKEERIGLSHLPMRMTGTVKESERVAFRDGFLRRMRENGLYRNYDGGLRLIEETLFRATVSLPANVPAGRFTARVHLFIDGRVVDSRALSIAVDKTGFERLLFTFAHRLPLLYGLSAVVVALLAGWLAGLVSRRT